MEVREASGKFKLFPIDGDGTERCLPSARGFRGKVFLPNGKEPTNLRPLELQETGHLPVVGNVHFMMSHSTENPYQHVEEVNADIGGDSAGLIDVAFPRGKVPLPPGGDVREVDGVLFPCRCLPDLFPKSHDGRMEPELEDIVDPLPRFLFQLGEGIEVPGAQNERLLADRIRADAEGEPHMRVVKIIGGADADEVYARILALSPQLFRVPVEPLEFGEESHIEEIAVHDSDGIGFVQGGDEPVPGIPDGPHVARGDVAGRADQCKVPRSGDTHSFSLPDC